MTVLGIGLVASVTPLLTKNDLVNGYVCLTPSSGSEWSFAAF